MIPGWEERGMGVWGQSPRKCFDHTLFTQGKPLFEQRQWAFINKKSCVNEEQQCRRAGKMTKK